MSTVLEDRSFARTEPDNRLAWGAILVGLAALYVPTYLDLAAGLWRDDEYAHGPIILAVFAWLVWRRRAALFAVRVRTMPFAGGALLALGLATYLLGRTQGLMLFEVASHLPVIAGAVLLASGYEALRRMAFPLLFLVFLIPLPGFVLDFATVPLKELVSGSVAPLLQALGYPVERAGVVLRVGSHEMLVADACSGLNSLYSLFALGLLYSNVTAGERDNRLRTLLLLAAVVPIAVAANIFRVLALVLVTYHLGEEAARGFLHDFAGMMVFVTALLLLVGFDRLLARVLHRDPVKRREIDFVEAGTPRLTVDNRRAVRRASLLALAATAGMAATAIAAPVLKPVPDTRPAPDLEQIIPASFGDWKIDTTVVPLPPTPDVEANLARLYRQIVSRTYVNSMGEQMMLTVAHGGDQSDALKAHRQEACYAAQGFEIRSLGRVKLDVAGREIPVTRMHAVRGERSEPVTYWFTMGDRVVMGRLERLRVQLEHGFNGRIPDGMLVRVSSITSDPLQGYAAQSAFIAATMAALDPRHAPRFIGPKN